MNLLKSLKAGVGLSCVKLKLSRTEIEVEM